MVNRVDSEDCSDRVSSDKDISEDWGDQAIKQW